MFSLFSASSIVSYATRIRYMNMFCLYLSLLLSLTPDLGWLSWLLQAIQLRMGVFMPQQYAQLLRLRFANLILLSVSCIVIECNQKAIETKRKKWILNPITTQVTFESFQRWCTVQTRSYDRLSLYTGRKRDRVWYKTNILTYQKQCKMVITYEIFFCLVISSIQNIVLNCFIKNEEL